MDASDQLLLSLKSWPTTDSSLNTIAALIPRIQVERGSFRDTTEALLEAEVLAQNGSKQNDSDDKKEDEGVGALALNMQEKPMDDKERREQLQRAREEIIAEIQMALHEATVTLDFLSLIASLHNPENAYLTLTHGLKDVIPVKSMGVEKINTKYPPQVIQDDKLISQGWKTEGLNSAADAMLKAAARLKTESEKEKRYWEQIMSIRDEGWTICKLPSQRNTLGVRYGFAEAAPEYKEKGIGALRRGEDGSIDMEDINASRAGRKAVRVKILDGGKVTGQSRPSKSRADNPTLKDKIETARDFIYEDELFFEIMKEARLIANQGIMTSEDAVTIAITAERSVQIDTAPIDEEPLSTDVNDDLAQAVGLALRILLSYGHRLNLRRRSKPQPPLHQRKLQPQTLPLLRPIATHLCHSEQSKHLLKFCGRIRDIAHSAGLPANFVMSPLKNCKPSNMKDIESSIETLLAALETEAVLELPGGWRVSIIMRTSLMFPPYGTVYAVIASHDGVCARLMGRHSIPTTSELESYLLWCLERSVVNAIRVMPNQGWEQLAQGNTMEKNDEKCVKRITVHVEKAGLHLRWGYAGGRDSEYIWNGSGVDKDLAGILREI
ncbi:subunit 17 of mediator complex-domain-containing protein [Kalaharituber pfeilii]|nr:subunit 17 of mediator complex-domain-containing protein [Kalaharituber pfeilii]